MKVTSHAFNDGGKIPDKYTKYGENRVPPLHFEDVPEKARSLALIFDDLDAPSGTFNHWILFNMDPTTRDIKEDAVPVIATQGQNDYGEVAYGGPRPPSGEHRYFFKAYALDTVLPLSRGSQRAELEREMKDHVIDTGTLMGTYAHWPPKRGLSSGGSFSCFGGFLAQGNSGCPGQMLQGLFTLGCSRGLLDIPARGCSLSRRAH